VSTAKAVAVDTASARVAVADDGGVEETAMAMPTRRGTPGTIVGAVDGSGSRVTLLRGEYVNALAFDRWRGALMAATIGGALLWWTAGETPSRMRQPFNDSSVRVLALTERWLVLAPDRCAGEATLELYDAERFVHVASVPVPSGLSPNWIAVSPNGRALATPEPPGGRRLRREALALGLIRRRLTAQGARTRPARTRSSTSFIA
jgi:hypothetical protein